MADVIIKKLTQEEFQCRNISRWPIWEKEASRFVWPYEETEECYFIEGEADIITDKGTFKVVEGDFVTFEKGLKCTWDIKKTVKKHYNFI